MQALELSCPAAMGTVPCFQWPSWGGSCRISLEGICSVTCGANSWTLCTADRHSIHHLLSGCRPGKKKERERKWRLLLKLHYKGMGVRQCSTPENSSLRAEATLCPLPPDVQCLAQSRNSVLLSEQWAHERWIRQATGSTCCVSFPQLISVTH